MSFPPKESAIFFLITVQSLSFSPLLETIRNLNNNDKNNNNTKSFSSYKLIISKIP